MEPTPMADVIRIGAIDDHPLYLDGLKRSLNRMRGMEVVAIGATADEAVAICTEHQIDVLMLDIGIPGGGINAIRGVLSKCPKIKIIMLTGLDDDEYVDKALALGAHGFMLKGANSSELRHALREVIEGRTYVMPAVATRLLLQKIRLTPASENSDDRLSRLNEQERNIYELMCKGQNNVEIAQALNLSRNTVRNYVSRILFILKARNRVEAILSKGNR
jgi:DNA-binding NarL/FixJ family response regulator